MGERKVMWYEFPILITIWALIIVVITGMREWLVFDKAFVLKYGTYVLLFGFVLVVIAYIYGIGWMNTLIIANSCVMWQHYV